MEDVIGHRIMPRRGLFEESLFLLALLHGKHPKFGLLIDGS